MDKPVPSTPSDPLQVATDVIFTGGVPQRLGRKTIAFLTEYPDSLGDTYGTHLRDALDAACRLLDINLLIVVGRGLEDPDPNGSINNKVFDWIHPETVDGIIVLATSLSAYGGSDAVARLYAKYQTIPLCGLGIAIDGVPSVVIDNRLAMRGVVEHLVLEHGCRRPLFLGGPPTNDEAQVRLAAFRDVFEENGIPLTPKQIRVGHFLRANAEAEIHAQIAEGAEFDAIIAANDSMALGALAALRKHGRRVPHDVMVTGFDDVHEVALVNPPMTTARQPLKDMANLALRTVLEQLEGRRVKMRYELPTELVIRRSCGCGTRALCGRHSKKMRPADQAITYAEENAERLTALAERLFGECHFALADRARQLLTGLHDEMAGSSGSFGDALDAVLGTLGSDSRVFQQLQEFVTLLRDEFQPFVTPELEDMWHEARCSLMLACARSQVAQRMDIAGLYTRVAQTVGQFASAARHIPQDRSPGLPGAIVENAFVSRLVGESEQELEPWFFIFEGRLVAPPLSRFPVHHLIPGKTYPDNRRHTSFVFALVRDMTLLGAAVLEFSPNTLGHEILCDQLAVVLHNQRLHEEVLRTTTLHERSVQERIATARRIQSLSVLAGGVAHDLNNALGPLVALPDIILSTFDAALAGDTQAADEMRADIEAIKHASLRASRTIKDLLTLGRQGRTEKGLVDVNLVVLDSLPRNLARLDEGDERKVTLATEISPERLWVSGSEPHLVRAITNLLRNAMEAIPGRGSITVGTYATDIASPIAGFETIEPGTYAAVSIADTGIGIPETELGQVFEPFFSRKRLGDESGTGLGLAIVHGVVKDHGGYVDVQSKVGLGTTFILYFPRASGALASNRVHSSPVPVRQARILVVDDELVQLRTSRRILTSLGYEVETCGSGAEALALIDASLTGEGEAARCPYDLVILDMVLHEDRDGLELLDAIRELIPEQRAIIASGHAPTERIERALSAGLIWLPKPYTKSELEHTVRRALARPTSVRSPEN
jgi:phosphoserine phosphatase RsbU/P